MDIFFNSLAGACGVGFMFLLGWVMKLHSEIKDRPTFDWCEAHFTSKDLVELQLDQIKKDVHEIKENVKQIAANGKKHE